MFSGFSHSFSPSFLLLSRTGLALSLALLMTGQLPAQQTPTADLPVVESTPPPRPSDAPPSPTKTPPSRASSVNMTRLSMADCINMALAKNPTVQQARERIKQSKGVTVEAFAQVLPKITAAGVGQVSDPNRVELLPFQREPNDESWQVQFRVTQTVFSGGRIIGSILIAKLGEDSAVLGLQETIDDAILAVRKSYYNVLLGKALITVADQSIQLLQEELSNQQRRFNAGTVTRFNVLRAEVELANARPKLIRAKNTYRISQAELAKLIAFDMPDRNVSEAPFELVGTLVARDSQYSLDQTMNMAFVNRPELASADKAIEIQEKQLTVDRAGYFPTISLFGGYDFIGSTYSNARNSTEGYIGGVQGQWNIFDGFETKGRMDQTRAKINAAKFAKEDTLRQVELDVRRAYSKLLEATEFIESQRKNVESAEESLRLASARFDAGAGTQLDTLNSQVALTEARTNELQARYDVNTALAELERAAGIAVRFVDGSAVQSGMEMERPMGRTPVPQPPPPSNTQSGPFIGPILP